MEKNTVLLGLPEYNELREFKEQLEKNNSCRALDYTNTVYNNNGYYPAVTFVTTDEAVKEIAAKNEGLIKHVEALNAEILKLKYPPKDKELTVNDVKKMSVWEFRRWKNKAW